MRRNYAECLARHGRPCIPNPTTGRAQVPEAHHRPRVGHVLACLMIWPCLGPGDGYWDAARYCRREADACSVCVFVAAM